MPMFVSECKSFPSANTKLSQASKKVQKIPSKFIFHLSKARTRRQSTKQSRFADQWKRHRCNGEKESERLKT
jgi:hypothetical protein